MRTRILFTSLILILSLTACAGNAANAPLSPEQQAYAQTQFVQQAGTSAAAFAHTAQPNAEVSQGAPTETAPTAANQIPGAQPTQPNQPTQPTHAAATRTASASLPTAQPTPGSPQPVNPTNTRASAPTPTPTRPAAPSPTNTPSPTATQPSGWQGDWDISFQKEDGTYLSGQISVNMNGSDLAAEGLINGIRYQFTGRLIYDNQHMMGTWSSPQTSGSFNWTLVSPNQFAGDRDLWYGFCGARQGSNLPTPCYLPPLS